MYRNLNYVKFYNVYQLIHEYKNIVIKCYFLQLFLYNLGVFHVHFSKDLWGEFSNCDVLFGASVPHHAVKHRILCYLFVYLLILFLFFAIAPSSLRFEPVGRWYEANIHWRQHGLSSHHSSSSASSSASSEGGYSSDEEDHRFLLTLDPTDWKVTLLPGSTVIGHADYSTHTCI